MQTPVIIYVTVIYEICRTVFILIQGAVPDQPVIINRARVSKPFIIAADRIADRHAGLSGSGSCSVIPRILHKMAPQHIFPAFLIIHNLRSLQPHRRIQLTVRIIRAAQDHLLILPVIQIPGAVHCDPDRSRLPSLTVKGHRQGPEYHSIPVIDSVHIDNSSVAGIDNPSVLIEPVNIFIQLPVRKPVISLLLTHYSASLCLSLFPHP